MEYRFLDYDEPLRWNDEIWVYGCGGWTEMETIAEKWTYRWTNYDGKSASEIYRTFGGYNYAKKNFTFRRPIKKKKIG